MSPSDGARSAITRIILLDRSAPAAHLLRFGRTGG
jgi:hypothetical protein